MDPNQFDFLNMIRNRTALRIGLTMPDAGAGASGASPGTSGTNGTGAAGGGGGAGGSGAPAGGSGGNAAGAGGGAAGGGGGAPNPQDGPASEELFRMWMASRGHGPADADAGSGGSAGSGDGAAGAAGSNAPDPDGATDDAGTDKSKWTAEQWKADAEKWKGLSRKNESEARANRTAAKKLADLERAQMTVQEKLQADLAAAQAERDEARSTHLRIMSAASHELPADFVEFLGSGTEDEINARADKLSSVMERSIQTRVDEELLKLGFQRTDVPNGNGQGGTPGPFQRPTPGVYPGGLTPAGNGYGVPGQQQASQDDLFRDWVQGNRR